MSRMVREYASVVRYALPGLLSPRAEPRRLSSRTRAAVGLSLATLRHAGGALRGLLP